MPNNSTTGKMQDSRGIFMTVKNTASFENTGSNFGNGGVMSSDSLTNDNILNLVYPEYLREDEYKNRRITFIASEKSTAHYDTDSKVATGFNVVKSAVGSMINSSSSLLSDVTFGQSEFVTGKRESFTEMLTKACITVPLPSSQLTENQAHLWSQSDSILHNLASSGIKTVQSGYAESKTKGEAPKSFKSNMIKAVSTMDIDKVFGATADSLGFRKPLLNPNYWQNYTGSTPRVFSLEVDFIPQSQKEAQIVKKIIKTFKAYSSPELTNGGVTLNSPHYWNVIISNAEISDMYRMDNLVLTNIAINYGVDGKMSLHGDGFPKHTQMSLTFTESHITYMENYQMDYSDWVTDRNSQMLVSVGDHVLKEYGLVTNKISTK